MSRSPRVKPVGITWPELVIGPEPTFVYIYSDEAEAVELHFDFDTRQYLLCPGPNCSRCTGPYEKPSPFRLVPVLSLRLGASAYLRVPPGHNPNALGTLIAKALDYYGTEKHVFGFSRNEVGEYRLRVLPIEDLEVEQLALIHLYQELSALASYDERRKGFEQSRPSEAIPIVPTRSPWGESEIGELEPWDEGEMPPEIEIVE